MLLQLSTTYRKQIALFFSYVFLVSGLSSLASSARANYPYSSGRSLSIYQHANQKSVNYSVFKNPAAYKAHWHRAKAEQVSRENTDGVLKTKDDNGGPSQPEMAGFKPVGSDNMVDLFSGDFSYNIPLLDVGGYPVNIFYNSGITMDQEASWVGLGWNINPGTIMRNMRGLPDDFDGEQELITKTQFTRDETTYGVNVGGNVELFGLKTSKLNLNAGIFYNNQRGVGLSAGVSPSIGIGSFSGDEKTAPLNFGWGLQANSQDGGSQTFSISLKGKEKSGLNGSLSASVGYHSRVGMQSLRLTAELSKSLTYQKNASAMEGIKDGFEVSPTMSSTISFAYPAVTPSIRTRLFRTNYSLDLGTGGELWGVFGHVRLGGFVAQTRIKPEDVVTKQPAYGMLYLQKARDRKDALLDFNRLNDGVYTPNSPTIAIPAYTYDVFSVSGEGTGGSFRLYRGDVGYVSDPYTETKSESVHLGVEFGAGAYGEGGVNATLVNTPSSAGTWERGNLAKSIVSFKDSRADFQSVYFKNPGEKALPDVAYQEAVGGEDMVRLKMTGTGVGSPTLTSSLLRYTDTRQRRSGTDLPLNEKNTLKKRDRRTQVISFLTAYEADRVGLNKKIRFVSPTMFYDTIQTFFGCDAVSKLDSMKRFDNWEVPQKVRKQHHISEITVLNQDGRRYIYDLPVYNVKQIDITFNKRGDNAGTAANSQTTSYMAKDAVANTNPGMAGNTEGKDWYVEKQELPAYAHSYLLSALVSPNYVDVTGDGLTDDDMGDAIKFNYGKLAKNFKWRTPIGTMKATFNEGLKTDPNDDKASYIWGEREAWYLYSVESKNMIARFYVKNDRKDNKSVNENGSIDGTSVAHRLNKISLFSKADLLKDGVNARPIKTVHFVHDYSLCDNVPNADGGKLTLRAIYFTYNGNDKVKKNYYQFNYPSSKNFDYDFRSVDRWGNYKPATHNQNGLKNSDYPYTNINKAHADEYAAAWTVNEIKLPSGGTINITYEADDYAYVQDRRASNMFQVKGFGSVSNPDATQVTNPNLYEQVGIAAVQHSFIYIKVPVAITGTAAEAQRKIRGLYLSNLLKSKQLFMKLAVNMPSSPGLAGYEMVPIYAEIDGDNFGVVEGAGGDGGKVIYIKVKKLESGFTPMVQYSLQFMKNFLPAKAYPGYDVSESGGLVAIVKALGGLFHSLNAAFKDGMKLFISEGKCKNISVDNSFVRLTNPYLKKPGGGTRVKKIVISDNWNKMTRSTTTTNDGMAEATYGQEYFYEKKELVGNEIKTISSGVASWEPTIGGEENSHREIMSYYNRNKRGPFDYSTVELPLAEMFFPAPSVGYSRVEVKSIHRDTVKNSPGVQVTDFYTTREFPFTSNYTPLEEYDATDKFEPSPLLQLFKIDINKAVALSQGFKVELNDMNGKMRKQATYAPNNTEDAISYTEYFYNISKSGENKFKFNHQFPVIEKPDGLVKTSILGRDIEIMTDFRQHKMDMVTTDLNFNLDVINGFIIPIPIPTFFSPVAKETNTFRSASILKIVNHYAMVDSIVAVDKGSMVSTKNMVYDAETGNAIVTRTNNEHNHPLYNFNYPSHWAYSGMGLAYKNIDVTYSGIRFRHGKLETPGVDMSLFESGDEIMVESQFDMGPRITEPCDKPTIKLTGPSFWELFYFFLASNWHAKSAAKKIWAVSTGKVGSKTPEYRFMDEKGEPYTAEDVKMKIIRSGKRNMLDQGVGSILSLSNPIRIVGGTMKLIFDDATNVVKTSSAVFKDHWRVDNQLYFVDSLLTIVDSVQAEYISPALTPVKTLAMSHQQVNLKTPFYSFTQNSYKFDNASTALTASHKRTESGILSFKTEKRFAVLYDLSSIPTTNFQLYSAYLILNPHATLHAGVHDAVTPHFNPSIGNNSLSINPMTTSWKNTYADNDPQWINSFNSVNIPTSNSSFIPSTNSGFIASSYITSTFRQMLFAKSNPSLGRATGLIGRLFLPGWEPAGEEPRQCFNINDERLGSDFIIHVSYFPTNEKIDSIRHAKFKTPAFAFTSRVERTSFCLSKFTKKAINPYVEGIWGNWRADTSFVYYGNRREKTASASEIDLRRAGVIENFRTFWTLTAPYLGRNHSASDVWVWNSRVTQFNRKGYDIENQDALGRYNAGLYGYNQQLPVAVVNNSMYRESMFDGFEDYDYETNTCGAVCKPRKHARIVDADDADVNAKLSTEEKHSGRRSLKLLNVESAYMNIPVFDKVDKNRDYSMRVKVDSTYYVKTTLGAGGVKGTGLKATYFNHSSWPPVRILEPSTASGSTVATRTEPIIRIQNTFPVKSGNNPVNGLNGDFFSVKWEGKIQIPETGSYTFEGFADNCFRIRLAGNQITSNGSWAQPAAVNSEASSPVSLVGGQVYTIEVSFYETWGAHSFDLKWRMNGGDLKDISTHLLYTPTATTFNQVINDTIWCTRLDTVQVRDKALTDTFSLFRGEKVLFSAWVKEGGKDCKCSTYTSNKVTVGFKDSDGNDAYGVTELKPSGNIIEGWQRYEGFVSIPADIVTRMTVRLQNLGSDPVYFDDVRIHPYNSNMKSFVYDSKSLRLMAELDENNFATYYEYDDDGTITRLKKETERGIKTIRETRSALQKAE